MTLSMTGIWRIKALNTVALSCIPLLTACSVAQGSEGFGSASVSTQAAQEKVVANALESMLQLDPAAARKGLLQVANRSSSAVSGSDDALAELSFDPRARKLKVALIFAGDLGAIRNNLAAAYILEGNSEEAIRWLDLAAELRPNDSAIWVNAALANIDIGRTDVAGRNIEMARSLGDTSSLLTVADAEAAIKALSLPRAEEIIKAGLLKDPNHPFLLLLKSRIDLDQGRLRESEKTFSQAVVQGRSVAANSLIRPVSQRGYVLGGGPNAFNLDFASQQFADGGRFSRFAVRTDRLNVEGRPDAYQWRDRFEGILSAKGGSVIVQHNSSGGGRPGAEEPIAGVVPVPDSRFRLASTNLLVTAESKGKSMEVTGFAKYRSSTLQTRNSVTDWADQVQDDVFNIEARAVANYKDNSKLTSGFAWSQFRRGSTSSRPFDPAEVVMPDGTTRSWLGYALWEKNVSPVTATTFGFVAAKLSSSTVLQPVAEFRLGKSRPIRFGVTSRVNDSVSDLFPAHLLSDSPLQNSIDRHELQPQDFNTNPVLSGRDTRFLNYELKLPGREGPRIQENWVLFHRRMENALLQAADPRAATNLLLTPVGSGEATGVEWHMEQSLRSNSKLKTDITYQVTSGSPTTPVFSLSSYPVQVPTEQNSLANFPRLQANIKYESVLGSTTYTVGLAYLGPRPRAVSVRDISGDLVTYVGEAEAALGINVFALQKIRPGVNMMLGAFNLGRAKFYTGYPARATGFLGIDYRF